MPAPSPPPSSLPLGKYLASTDKKTRDKAVRALSAFLSNGDNAQLPEKEMTKLWKGIFYCFWMSDKPLVQQALATDLANVLLSIPDTQAALAFLKGFWNALVREWAGIDRLRLDKYYMLIRRYANASFRLLMRTKWDSEVCERHNAILTGEGGPLNPSDAKAPSGLQYHLADVYLSELEKALESFASDAPPAPLRTILQPYLHLASLTPSKITFKRIQSAVFDPLLFSLTLAAAASSRKGKAKERPRKKQKVSAESEDASSSDEDEDEDNEEEIPLHHIVTLSTDSSSTTKAASTPKEVKKAVLDALFAQASRESSLDANRRRMYAICKAGRDDEGDD